MTDSPDNNLHQLIEKYELALENNPDGELYARTAMAYLAVRRNLWKALEYFYKAIDAGHATPQYREGLAACHLLLRQLDEAADQYRLLEDNGYLTFTMACNVASIHVQQKNYKVALVYLERADKLCSDSPARLNVQRNIVYTQRLMRGELQPPDPDLLFRQHVDKNIDILRNLKKPDLLPPDHITVRGCAIIIELRQHPWLEHSMRNVAHFLPEGWGMLVIHGNKNKGMVQEIISAWGMNTVIEMRNLQRNNITQREYSNLLKQPAFWQKISAERALIFQTDAMLLKSGLEAFYEWDYIGAPWNDLYVPEGVGNGGLSLRTVAAMSEISSRYVDESPVWEFEDMFFSRVIHQCGEKLTSRAIAAPRAVAHKFSAECQLRDLPVPLHPLGIHQAWRFYSEGQVRKWFGLAESAYTSN